MAIPSLTTTTIIATTIITTTTITLHLLRKPSNPKA
jgi:hypothetical protein